MRIRRLAAWNIAEAAAGSLMLFVLYRVVVGKLGVQAVGIWSVVSATTSIGRAFDPGAAGGLARFVALSDAGEERRAELRTYVDTAILIAAAVFALVSVVMYVPARLSLAAVMHGAVLSQALALLPFSLAAFSLSSIGNIVASALIGLRRSDQKSGVAILSLAIQAGVALWLVPRVGLNGLAIAQLAQCAVQLICGWVLVCSAVAGRLSLAVPTRFGRAAAKDLLGFGARLQTITLMGFLHEPAVRYVFTAVGGIAMVGYYEMASRCVTQLRALLSAPAQNLVPLFASLSVDGRGRAGAIYYNATLLIGSTATVALATLATVSPLISVIWIGHLEWRFVTFVALCCAGWGVNIIAVPAFYLGVGFNQLRWNVLGTAVTTIASPLSAWLLGVTLGANGLVAGAMLGTAAGSLLTMKMNTRDAGLKALPEVHKLPERLWAVVTGRQGV